VIRKIAGWLLKPTIQNFRDFYESKALSFCRELSSSAACELNKK
jgi:hypothetical protein